MGNSTWVGNRGNYLEHHQGTLGRRNRAASLGAFPPQLRPPQTRDSDKATILLCLGDPTPKPERLE